MASNSLPTNTNQLIQLGNNMSSGLTSLGQSLGITQITPADFQRDLAALTAGEDTFNAARSAVHEASDTVKSAMGELAEWLSVVRGVLTGVFGPRWSTLWAQAGFVNRSTAVPARVDQRIVLGERLVAFFTANPGTEVASMDVTAAHGTALGAAVQSAKQALAKADVALTDASEGRDAAWTTLTTVMRMLIGILSGLLPRTDARWLAFGLNIPASNTTPGMPVNLSAHGDGMDRIVVQCDPVPLATRYRWRTRILGSQEDFTLAASTVDPVAPLSGFAPGSVVEILVQAVNGQQQGVASEPIEFTLPASEPRGKQPSEEPMAAAPVGAVEAVAAGAVKPAGNGRAHGNGDAGGNGHGGGSSHGGGNGHGPRRRVRSRAK